MLDHAFCEALEYRLCIAFKNAKDDRLKGFWCDGVSLPDDGNNDLQKVVSNNKQVSMQAFIGKNGQMPYGLTLKFGKKALRSYASRQDMIACIPQTDFDSWIKIDTSSQEIEVQLD